MNLINYTNDLMTYASIIVAEIFIIYVLKPDNFVHIRALLIQIILDVQPFFPSQT